MTDPTLDWLRSEMEDVRERLDKRYAFVNGRRVALDDIEAALAVLDRIRGGLADADMDALFDALDRLEEAAGPEVVEVLGELRDAALSREDDDA